MSTRVFNPVIMSEMRRRILRDAGGSGVVAAACAENNNNNNQQAPQQIRQDVARLRRVCRDLFGPVDHEDSRKFVEKELAEQQARDADRWGFDFVRGSPRKSGPGTGRYIWEKVSHSEKIPEPYALRGMQYLSRIAVDDAPTPATTATEIEEAANATSSEQSSTRTNHRQSRITDYMKDRKRPLAVKPLTTPVTAPKKARMTNS